MIGWLSSAGKLVSADQTEYDNLRSEPCISHVAILRGASLSDQIETEMSLVLLAAPILKQ
jgi:hypothetical protein